MLHVRLQVQRRVEPLMFQWAPTLGGECYAILTIALFFVVQMFQWAPTLGDECYSPTTDSPHRATRFNGHPPLGVNATTRTGQCWSRCATSFNGHPPLGVNATCARGGVVRCGRISCFNGHPPLGVNATQRTAGKSADGAHPFQWAPTLGGECYKT